MTPQLDPRKEPMLPAAGAQPLPRPTGPMRPQPKSSVGGAASARRWMLLIVPAALLVCAAALVFGLAPSPAGRLNLAGLFFAAGRINASAVSADRDDTLGRIGVTVSDLTGSVAKSMSLQTSRRDGVVLVKVWPNTSAERAGLRKGDIVLAVDGIPVRHVAELVTKIDYTPVDQRLTLILERNGTTQAMPVQVEPWCTQTVKLSDACTLH